MLPQIRSSSEVYGPVREGGVLAGVPIAGILGDQQAATFGQACFEPGMAKNTYGTGNFVLLNTGTEPVASEHGLITTVCYRIGEQPPVYALEGSVAVTGSLVQWLRDNLRLIDSADEIEALARTRRRQRRGLRRPRVQRAVRPALALGRPRRHRRPHPLRQPRSPGPRRAGGRGVPVAGGDRGDERRLRASR